MPGSAASPARRPSSACRHPRSVTPSASSRSGWACAFSPARPAASRATEAGERLLRSVGPHFDEIEAGLAALSDLRDKPAGTIRITASDHPAETVLWPALEKFLPDYPDIHVEISVDDTLRDIVEERFDAGVRLGEQIAKDMIAVRIGPDVRMVVVGSPAYFEAHTRPRTPHDLAEHQCINLRLRTLGGFYPWEFEKRGRELKVRVEGQLAFNDARLMIKAARSGLGLAYVFRDLVKRTYRAERSFPCSRTGVRPSPATTFIIPAAASNRRLSPCW